MYFHKLPIWWQVYPDCPEVSACTIPVIIGQIQDLEEDQIASPDVWSRMFPSPPHNATFAEHYG